MKDIHYYRSLPYQPVWERVPEPDGGWYWQVHFGEIPGVVGRGDTEEEAAVDLRGRFDEYVRWRIDHGLDIAEPVEGDGPPAPRPGG